MSLFREGNMFIPGQYFHTALLLAQSVARYRQWLPANHNRIVALVHAIIKCRYTYALFLGRLSRPMLLVSTK